MSSVKQQRTLLSPSVRGQGKSSKGSIVIDVPADEKVKMKPDGEIDLVPPHSKMSKMDAKEAKKMEKQREKDAKKMHKDDGKHHFNMAECPALGIFIVISLIVLVYQVFVAITNAPPAANDFKSKFKYWVFVAIALVITLAVVFFFGWWIRNECANCKPGRAWMVLILAALLPFVLGLIFHVFVGALRGGVGYLDKILGKCDKNKPKPSDPVTAPAVPSDYEKTSAAPRENAKTGIVPRETSKKEKKRSDATELGNLRAEAQKLVDDE